MTKDGLSYDLVKTCKQINTERILMPLNLVYERTNIIPKYKGYTTKLITNIKNKAEIINIDSNHLYNEIKTLISDVELLSSNKVLIKDIVFDGNIVFNNNIYFVDPGSYYIDKTLSNNNIYDQNMEEISMALYKHLFCLDNKLECIYDELKNFNNIACDNINCSTILSLINKIYEDDYHKNFLNSNKKYYLEYLKYMLEKYETISNYKLKILKEYIIDSNNEPMYVNLLKKGIK